jgi:hypothetical protein
MYVRYLVRDEPAGGTPPATRTAEYDDPTWERAESFIGELDGGAKTYVMLSPSRDEAGEQLFLIRAPAKGMYVCEVYDGDEYLLANPQGVPLEEPLLAGEFAFTSTAEFVGLTEALAAARTYFERGTRDPAFTWVNDGL